MDRVSVIIGYEWRAFWRSFSRAGLRGGNQGIVLIFAVLIAVKYLQFLLNTSRNLASGNTKTLAPLLAVIFVFWLFPLTSNARDTLASRRWLHLPLSLVERFFVRTISLMMPPAVWLVIACSLAICYPLAHAPNPVTGIIAGLLFIVLAWLSGLTVAQLLSNESWRMVFWGVALVLLIIGGVYVVRGGALQELMRFPLSPISLVESAAVRVGPGTSLAGTSPFISLLILGLLVVAAGTAALWSFKKSLPSIPGGPTGKISILSFHLIPGRLGGLVSKDFRYFRRLLDIYLGFAAALLACVYLIVAVTPSAGIFWSFIVVVLLCNAALPFNSFGLDNRAGLDRYALLPVSGRAILLSKNFAYLMIAGVQLLPMLLLAGWRLGIVESGLGLLEAIAILAAYLAWGNWMSINHPLKTQFFRFANSGAALVDAMGGIVFGSLPGIVMISLLQRERAIAAGGTALILLFTCTVYVISIMRFGERLSGKRERIAEILG